MNHHSKLSDMALVRRRTVLIGAVNVLSRANEERNSEDNTSVCAPDAKICELQERTGRMVCEKDNIDSFENSNNVFNRNKFFSSAKYVLGDKRANFNINNNKSLLCKTKLIKSRKIFLKSSPWTVSTGPPWFSSTASIVPILVLTLYFVLQLSVTISGHSINPTSVAHPPRFPLKTWGSPSQFLQRLSSSQTRAQQSLTHTNTNHPRGGLSFHGPSIRSHTYSSATRNRFLSGVRVNPQRVSYLSRVGSTSIDRETDRKLPETNSISADQQWVMNPKYRLNQEVSPSTTYQLTEANEGMKFLKGSQERSFQGPQVSEVLADSRYLADKMYPLSAIKSSPYLSTTNHTVHTTQNVHKLNTYPKATPLNSSRSLYGSNPNATFLHHPNDVLAVDDAPTEVTSARDDWDAILDPNVCRKIAGLTREQLQLCHKHVAATGAAALGMKLAVRECQRQLTNHRWNCSSLATRTNNPHSAAIMATGYSESGFGHAMVSAGVTHSVSRACSAGRLNDCSCGRVGEEHQWKWSGCHDNTRYGARFSRQFLDVREAGPSVDLVAFTHLHNNELGRKIVRRNRAVQCKCHGMSGSCEVRTCWKAAPEFRRVGDLLRRKYRKAQAIERKNNRKRMRRKMQRPDKRLISPKSPLLYASKSPSYCEHDGYLRHPGTHGRQCNSTSGTGKADSCDNLCCGRGYKVFRRKVVSRCNCHFQWCCKVTCQDCTVVEDVTVCN